MIRVSENLYLPLRRGFIGSGRNWVYTFKAETKKDAAPYGACNVKIISIGDTESNAREDETPESDMTSRGRQL